MIQLLYLWAQFMRRLTVHTATGDGVEDLPETTMMLYLSVPSRPGCFELNFKLVELSATKVVSDVSKESP